MDAIILCRVKDVPKDFHKLPFGRQIDHWKKIREFQANAKSTHVSQKRQNWRKAIKEFKDLYCVDEFYTKFHAGEHYWDDSFEVWYTSKS